MTIKSPAMMQAILDRIGDDESLRSICRDPAMPGLRTVMDWLRDDEDFRNGCARARDMQGDAIHDSMIDIEDRVLRGELDEKAARVVLSSRQWRAAKVAPKKYGDKIDATVSGDLVVRVIKLAMPNELVPQGPPGRTAS